MKKYLRKLSVLALVTLVICGAHSMKVNAATEGLVTATLKEKSVYGTITANEVGKHLTVKLKYKTMDTLSGKVYPDSERRDSFGNCTNVGCIVSAGTHRSMCYLKVTGYVNDVLKREVELRSYGTCSMEYWE